MFSDHLRKDIDMLPRIKPAVLAAIVMVIFLLSAISFIADGQMQKAEIREQQRLAQQVAYAECVERNSGPMRHGCIQQIQVALDAKQALASIPRSDMKSARNESNAQLAEAAVETGAARVIQVKLTAAN
jgi:hypothetical protein